MAWSLVGMTDDFAQRVQEIKEIPPLPHVAQALLQLKNDPNADAKALSKLVQLDPGLASQMMRYANSAFFSYRGKIDSIQDAVSRVLGFDRALHIAVGLSAGKSLRHSQQGPLGLDAFWRHAVYSATLMQALAQAAGIRHQVSPGLVYLAGLVHDIGHLLLGYLLEAEFAALNKVVSEQPGRRVVDIESELLGVSHDEMGVWVLRKWKLPTEVLVAVMHHHNDDYCGEYATYAQLTALSDEILSAVEQRIEARLSPRLLANLGLKEDQSLQIANDLLTQRDGLESLVQQVLKVA